jgi:predicted acylesterase/phospholipase RssA
MRGNPEMTATNSPLLSRDRHLFGAGPKRLLALDGGGIRGAISVAFLEKIEDVLSKQLKTDVRLGDYFDFVGGTSTGAIIAGALALGYRTEQIKDFYIRLAPHAFKREVWRIPILQSKFDARGLRGQIEAIIGERKLCSPDLITGLGIVTKRIDTGSPWVITNNPRAPYWNDGDDYIGNKHYRLSALVRASTAAPHFFDPELINIAGGEPKQAIPLGAIKSALSRWGLGRKPVLDPKTFGMFVDGGVSPSNNPSLTFFQIVALKAFGICWPMGPDKLTVVSIGTGTHRPRLSLASLGFARTPKLALHALMSLIKDTEVATLAQMQWFGECLAPWTINSEIGTLANDVLPGGKLFRFLRYDVRLEREWLMSKLDINLGDRDIERLRAMDNPSTVHELYEIGKVAADRQVKPEHWLSASI